MSATAEQLVRGWHHHHPVWVEQVNESEFAIECSCGGVWRRSRLADAAIAHERHQRDPRTWQPETRHPSKET